MKNGSKNIQASVQLRSSDDDWETGLIFGEAIGSHNKAKEARGETAVYKASFMSGERTGWTGFSIPGFNSFEAKIFLLA